MLFPILHDYKQHHLVFLYWPCSLFLIVFHWRQAFPSLPSLFFLLVWQFCILFYSLKVLGTFFTCLLYLAKPTFI